jgi:hypothetical protein
MLAFGGEIVDEVHGVRSYIYECEIESPVELTVTRNDAGGLEIGSTPPLYYVDTSLRPSYHHVSFAARPADEADSE